MNTKGMRKSTNVRDRRAETATAHAHEQQVKRKLARLMKTRKAFPEVDENAIEATEWEAAQTQALTREAIGNTREQLGRVGMFGVMLRKPKKKS